MLFLMIGCLCGGVGAATVLWSHGALVALCAAPIGASLLTFLMAGLSALVNTYLPASIMDEPEDGVVAPLAAH